MAIRVSMYGSQLLYVPGTFTISVEQDLALLQEPFKRTIQVNYVACQILVDGAVPPSPAEPTSDDLNLTEQVDAILLTAFRQVPENTLELVQTVTAFGYEFIQQDLGLEETINQTGPIPVTVNQLLGLQNNGFGFIGVPWAPIEIQDTLILTDRASHLSPVVIQQNLTLVQEGLRRILADNTITFTQTVVAGKGKLVSQSISLVDALETSSDYRRQVEDSPLLVQAFTYFIEKPCAKKQNQRLHGEGGVEPEPLRIEFNSKLRLESVTGAYTSVELRNPETDDRARYAFQRVNRELEGGDLELYADPTWNKTTTLLFTVIAMKQSMFDSLQQFMIDTLGQQIHLSDWTGTSWIGVITTPEEAAVEDGEGYWTLAFEFLGERYPGFVADSRLNLIDQVVVQGLFGRSATNSLELTQEARVSGPIYITVSEQIPFQEGG
jgi:hypothetical protein